MTGNDCKVYTIMKETNAKGKTVKYKMYLDRFIMGLPRDDPRIVIHLNGDELDNRRENLRIVDLENIQPRGSTE